MSKADLDEAEKLIKSTSYETEYEEEHELGRGRFAIVKRCMHRKTGKRYAAKLVKKSRSNTHGRSGREQLLMEISILSRSTHPKMVRLFDVFETRSEMQIILEFAEGGDLHRHCIETDIARTEKEICYLIRQILEATRYLHSEKIVHLDLKPDNILLAKKAEVFPDIRLIDFGLSRSLDGPYSQFDIVGTADYVSPEVLAFDPIDYGSDMWSIGVVTYVLLSGISPFAGDDVMETYANIGCVDYDFDCDEFDDISVAATDFIEKLLVRDPKQRMSAREALEHEWIQQLVGGVSTQDVLQAQHAKTETLPADLEVSPMQGEEGLASSSESDTSNEEDSEEEVKSKRSPQSSEPRDTTVEEKSKNDTTVEGKSKNDVPTTGSGKEAASEKNESNQAKTATQDRFSSKKGPVIEAEEKNNKIIDSKEVNGDVPKMARAPPAVKEVNGDISRSTPKEVNDVPPAPKDVNGEIPKSTPTPKEVNNESPTPKDVGHAPKSTGSPTPKEVNNVPKVSGTPKSGGISDKMAKFSKKPEASPLKQDRFSKMKSTSFDVGFLSKDREQKQKTENKPLTNLRSNRFVKSASVVSTSSENINTCGVISESSPSNSPELKRSSSANVADILSRNAKTESKINSRVKKPSSPQITEENIATDPSEIDITTKNSKTDSKTDSRLKKSSSTEITEESSPRSSPQIKRVSIDRAKTVEKQVESPGITANDAEKVDTTKDDDTPSTTNRKSPVLSPSKPSPPETKAKPKMMKAEDSSGKQSPTSKPAIKFDKKVNATESDDLMSNPLFRIRSQNLEYDSDSSEGNASVSTRASVEELPERQASNEDIKPMNFKPRSPPPVAPKTKSPIPGQKGEIFPIRSMSPSKNDTGNMAATTHARKNLSPSVSPSVSPTPKLVSSVEIEATTKHEDGPATDSIHHTTKPRTTPKSESPILRNVEGAPEKAPKSPPTVASKPKTRTPKKPPEVASKPTKRKQSDENVVPEKGVPEGDAPEEDVPEEGVPEKGVPEKGVPEKGLNITVTAVKGEDVPAPNTDVVEPAKAPTVKVGGGLKFSLNIGGSSNKVIGPVLSVASTEKKMVKQVSLGGSVPKSESTEDLTEPTPPAVCENTDTSEGVETVSDLTRPSLADTRGKSDSFTRRRSNADETTQRTKTYRRLYVTKVRNSKVYEYDFDVNKEAAKIAQRVDNDVLQVSVKLKSTDLMILPS